MLRRVFAIFVLIVFSALLLGLFFFITTRKQPLERKQVASELQTNNFTKNQFPKSINEAAASYTLRCIHTETVTDQYLISKNITVKVSLACKYIDANQNEQEVLLPLVLVIAKPDGYITQFLGGLPTGGTEGSEMTDRGIYYLIYEKLFLDQVGGEVIAMLTNEKLVGTISNGLRYTQEVYTENDLSTKKLENFALTGNPEILSIRKLNNKLVILPEYIELQKPINTYDN